MAKSSKANKFEGLRTKVAASVQEFYRLSSKQKAELLELGRTSSLEPLKVNSEEFSKGDLSQLKSFVKKLDAHLGRAPTQNVNEGALERAELTIQMIERLRPELLDEARKDLERGKALLAKRKKK